MGAKEDVGAMQATSASVPMLMNLMQPSCDDVTRHCISSTQRIDVTWLSCTRSDQLPSVGRTVSRRVPRSGELERVGYGMRPFASLYGVDDSA
jgi:hypothetical protein